MCVEATVRRGAAVAIWSSPEFEGGCPYAGVGAVSGCDLVADADFAVAEYVGAQASLVDQRSQCARLSRLRGQAFEVRARLAQPLPEALDAADPELFADERVEIDAAGDDVPAGLFGRELAGRKLQRVEHLGFDKREVVPTPMHVGERSALIAVPVALQSAPGPRHCSIDTNHRCLGFRSDRDGLDPSLSGVQLQDDARRLRWSAASERLMWEA